jgi:hypothetical protein
MRPIVAAGRNSGPFKAGNRANRSPLALVADQCGLADTRIGLS